MCGASKVSEKNIEAVTGATYQVKANDYGHGAFVPKGETVQSCTACVRGHQQIVTFMNLPSDIKKELGKKIINGAVVGRFVEVNTGNHHTSRDQIDCGDGIILDFMRFAGSTAFIGVHTDFKPKSATMARRYENA